MYATQKMVNTLAGDYIQCHYIKLILCIFFMFITFLNIRVSQCGYCAQYFVPKYLLKMACSDTEQH